MMSNGLKLSINVFRYITLYLLLMMAEPWGKILGGDSIYLQYLLKLLIGMIGTGLIIWAGRRVDGLTIPVTKTTSGTWIGAIISIAILISGSAIELIISDNAYLIFDASQWQFCLFIAFFVGASGILEEIFFRGVLFEISARYVSIFSTLVITSLLFCLFHSLDFKIDLATVSYFAFSILAGYLRVIFKSIWPSISLHFSWNFILALVDSDIGLKPILTVQSDLTQVTPYFYDLYSIVSYLLIIAILWKYNSTGDQKLMANNSCK